MVSEQCLREGCSVVSKVVEGQKEEPPQVGHVPASRCRHSQPYILLTLLSPQSPSTLTALPNLAFLICSLFLFLCPLPATSTLLTARCPCEQPAPAPLRLDLEVSSAPGPSSAPLSDLSSAAPLTHCSLAGGAGDGCCDVGSPGTHSCCNPICFNNPTLGLRSRTLLFSSFSLSSSPW